MMDKERRFLGTYFDRDVVIRWSRIIGILAWVIVGIYAIDVTVGLTVMVLQYARRIMVALGPTDVLQQLLYVIERPVHGILYFSLLQALSKGLLMALDIEDNTRRAARE